MAGPPPLLSLGSGSAAENMNPGVSVILPAWMGCMNAVGGSSEYITTTTTTTCSSSSTTVCPPSVSLTLSASADPVEQLVQYCKEAEEARERWVGHRKEATWRLRRLEQQLESEKARKRREKIEEVEGKIRSLRQEEMGVIGRMEVEYRQQLTALHRDADAKEAKLMEAWTSKQAKLTKLVDQIDRMHFPPDHHHHHHHHHHAAGAGASAGVRFTN